MLRLLWFRKDFRIGDNVALRAVTQGGNKIMAIFSLNSTQKNLGMVSRAWQTAALQNLNDNLSGALRIFSVDIIETLKIISSKEKIEALYFNRCYEPLEMEEEATLQEFAKEKNILLKSFSGYLLSDDFQLKNSSHEFYKVFTPYYKRVVSINNSFCGNLLSDINENKALISEKLIAKSDIDKFPQELSIEELSSKDDLEAKKIISIWKVGEKRGMDLLNSFYKKVSLYSKDRDFLAIDGTSKLAPYLHFGHILPERILYHLRELPGRENFHRQLIWRDFAYYTLFHSPNMSEECIQDSFKNFPWQHDEKKFEAWKNGETGIPIVDAAMNELKTTGYMHNRARMIVGSFLTKNLNIDWRLGQEHFWEYLADADLANNSFGWQWVAGCGRDAAPYFRIFNPVLQAEKFDVEAHYTKKFLPVLSNLSAKTIHSLHKISEINGGLSDFNLNGKYPNAIINLENSRKDALERFKTWKERKQ